MGSYFRVQTVVVIFRVCRWDHVSGVYRCDHMSGVYRWDIRVYKYFRRWTVSCTVTKCPVEVSDEAAQLMTLLGKPIKSYD